MEISVPQRCVLNTGDFVNQYVINKKIGGGTFGDVYKVTDTSSNVICALKLLKLWEVVAQERERLMLRFNREYETSQIPSEYLVHSFSKGLYKGNPYIVMEYCPGGDLEHVTLNRKFNYSKVATQILMGLQHLHQNGKIHRDLKPANVLIKENGVCALTDFGIAGDQNNRITRRGITGIPKELFGTYAYMPLEQMNPARGNATVLPTTDIYSFGAMMYELLCGHGNLPFGKLDSYDDLAIYQVNMMKGKWNRSKLMNVPDGKLWEPLLEGCLESDFKKRIQTAEEALRTVPFIPKNISVSISGSHDEIYTVKNGMLLRVLQGEEYGKTYLLNGLLEKSKIITIGRKDKDVKNVVEIKEIESSYISRRHCTLEYDSVQEFFILRDGQWCKPEWHESMNGTYLNSQEVDKNGTIVRLGDIISIGDVKIRLEGF